MPGVYVVRQRTGLAVYVDMHPPAQAAKHYNPWRVLNGNAVSTNLLRAHSKRDPLPDALQIPNIIPFLL